MYVYIYVIAEIMDVVRCPATAFPPFGAQSMQVVIDRLGIRNGNQFLVGSAILQHGVFITTKKWSKDATHKTYIEKKMVPVADCVGGQSLLRHVCFDREWRDRGGQTRWNPRGGKVIASRDRLASYFAGHANNSSEHLRQVYTTNTGVYWDNWHVPGQVVYVHPYLDIDIGHLPDDEYSFSQVFTPITETINLLNGMFNARLDNSNDAEQRTFEILILMNCRKDAPGTSKWSFHVHWPQLIVSSAKAMGDLVRTLLKHCPKDVIGNDLLDPRPYASKNQLFRLPYCGKMGNADAALYPIKVHKDGVGCWQFEVDYARDAAATINESCTCTSFPDAYLEVKVDLLPLAATVRRSRQHQAQGVVAPARENRHNYAGWMNFWGPVLHHFVLPNFIEWRQQQAQLLGVSCSFPDTSILSTTVTFRRRENYPASFCCQVQGDTFCVYDHGSTPHVHSFEKGAISYVVDLHEGRIAQQCVCCQPAALEWHHFITTNDLTFKVIPDDIAKFTLSHFVSVDAQTNVIPFVLGFCHDSLCFARDTRQVMAYNEKTGCWMAGSDGNRIVLNKINQLNSYHKSYCTNRNVYIRNKLVQQWHDQNVAATPDETKAAEDKFDKECRRANNSIKPIMKLTLTTRKDVIGSLKPDQHCHEVNAMEPFPHLVPLLDGVVLDLFTWRTRKISPSDYFVSTLNASLVHLGSPEVSEFMAWQMQVCCGDPLYMQYKMRIMGLSLTLFNFDRSFYMACGPIGRNGKGSEACLFQEILMNRTPARGMNVSREYLTKQAQDRKGANAADTVMMDLANKTILIADECRDVPLDGALIKSLVSGDAATARNLYEGERSNVVNRGTLWIIANKSLRFDYGDAALMDRLQILPYNAQWVRDPSAVKAQMTDAFQKQWVFQEDPYFKEKVLKTWNSAMVTKCLYELHLFLLQMPKDPETGLPVKLESFPLPPTVRKATRQKIAKEHPVLSFVTTYMTKTTTPHEYVTVEMAFSQFQRYGRNENSLVIKRMDRAHFQEALTKQHIEVEVEEDCVARFKYYKMLKEVPNPDAASSSLAYDGLCYEPPAKRARHEEGPY